MMTNEQKGLVLENIVDLLEIPDSAYEKAKERYENIGKWFGRKESLCKDNEPHIFPQGSFRLGTAIRPLDDKEEYDLDLACELQEGITEESHTQEEVKKLVGDEIETYRMARGIKSPKEEKHRCWRLTYQDDLSFHIDIVPCIPADIIQQQIILDSIRKAGESGFIANTTSQLTVLITDDRHDGYGQLCNNWNISNPEGYAKWFESRMNPTQQTFLEKSQVDDVPIFKRKNPLQRSIQLLKRHRDQWFKDNEELKPPSIIITTLAARAYQEEADINSALSNILSKMSSLVNLSGSKVPNLVDPGEDFADRWSMPENKYLNLEQNFWKWLSQAQNDFELIGSSQDPSFIIEQAEQKFSVHLNNTELSKRLGLTQAAISIVTPKAHIITEPAKPWKRER